MQIRVGLSNKVIFLELVLQVRYSVMPVAMASFTFKLFVYISMSALLIAILSVALNMEAVSFGEKHRQIKKQDCFDFLDVFSSLSHAEWHDVIFTLS